MPALSSSHNLLLADYFRLIAVGLMTSRAKKPQLIQESVRHGLSRDLQNPQPEPRLTPTPETRTQGIGQICSKHFEGIFVLPIAVYGSCCD